MIFVFFVPDMEKNKDNINDEFELETDNYQGKFLLQYISRSPNIQDDITRRKILIEKDITFQFCESWGNCIH